MRVASHLHFRFGIDPKAELGHEASGAKQPQRIFVEPLVGVAHRADDRLCDIGLPEKGIDEVVLGNFGGDGVHREVTAGQIVNQVATKLYRGEPGLVWVVLLPVGRDLDRDRRLVLAKDQTNRAKPLADQVRAGGSRGIA